MDPKLSGLDPKLREAYDRVMNGPVSPAGGPATPPSTPPQSDPAAVTQTQLQTPPPLVNPVVPPPPPIMPSSTPTMPDQPQAAQPVTAAAMPNPSPAINSTIAFNAHNSSLNKGTGDSKKSGGMKVLLIALGIIIFLVVYTFVWVYLFHLKLPFIG